MKLQRNFLTLGVALLAAPFLAQGQTTPVTCSNANLTGNYSLVLTGRNVSSTAVLSDVVLAVGTATFDGKGNVTLGLAPSTASSQGFPQTLTGSYNLPSNCLGTLTITGGDTASFTLIPYNSFNGFSLTGQDATYSITATGSAPPTECPTATLSGEYTFTGYGYTLKEFTVTGVATITGLLQFSGGSGGTVGTVTTSWTVTANGATTSNTLSGYYFRPPAPSSCFFSFPLTASSSNTDPNLEFYDLSLVETSADAENFSATITNANGVGIFIVNAHSTFTYSGLAVAVEDAAGGKMTTPPGSLFSIYGSDLSAGDAGFTNFPLPDTLSSASVTVNGRTVPIYGVSNTAGVINAQMPWDVQPGVATLMVTNGAAVSNAVTINVPATAQPAVFTYASADASNHALAQNFPSYTLNSESAQAPPISTVVVYLTGAGPVFGQNLLTTGAATPAGSQLFVVTESYSATIAGVDAPVQSIALVPTLVGGFYQANITVPPGIDAGDQALVITIGGKASNTTLLSIQ